MNNIKEMNLLCADVETGGLDPNVHSLLQIGLVSYKNGEIIDTLKIHIKEDNYVVTPKAMEVNGLNLTEVYNCGVLHKEAVEQIKEFIIRNFGKIKPILVGHNVFFDKYFIRNLLKKAELNMDDYISYRCIDTMSLLWGLSAAGKYPLESCSSENAFKYFNIKVEKLHDALEDALGTIKMFEKIIDLIK